MDEQGQRANVRGVIEPEALRQIKMTCAERGWLMAEFYERAFRRCVERIRDAKRAERLIRMREISDEAVQWSFYMDVELADELAEEVYTPRKTVYYKAIHDFLEELEEENEDV